MNENEKDPLVDQFKKNLEEINKKPAGEVPSFNFDMVTFNRDEKDSSRQKTYQEVKVEQDRIIPVLLDSILILYPDAKDHIQTGKGYRVNDGARSNSIFSDQITEYHKLLTPNENNIIELDVGNIYIFKSKPYKEELCESFNYLKSEELNSDFKLFGMDIHALYSQGINYSKTSEYYSVYRVTPTVPIWLNVKDFQISTISYRPKVTIVPC